MTIRDYLTTTNGFAWGALVVGAVCYFIAIIVVMLNDVKNVERCRNNWFVTGSAFLLVGLTVVVTVGTLGLAATPR